MIENYKMLNWNTLINPINPPEYIWAFFVGVGILILGAFAIQFFVEKKTLPKYYKNYLGKISNWLLYLPTVSILFLLALYLGISSLSLGIYFMLLGLIWLIWFLFLVYYRLVIIRFLSKKYKEKKQREKYRKHAN